MVIVIVRWYIKDRQDDKFKSSWGNYMDPTIKDGLFREFFSKPVDVTEEKYHTLDVESKHYTTYINVGIWRDITDFERAIGSLIPNREPHKKKEGKELIEVFDFEFKLRERIVMDVEEDRRGKWDLPPASIPPIESE